MVLITPSTVDEVRDALRSASGRGTRIGIVGGRTHADRGDPAGVDDELTVAALDRVVAYDPAEMLAVVEAGITVGRLREVLAGGGQEWPADAPADATVGGTIRRPLAGSGLARSATRSSRWSSSRATGASSAAARGP